MGLTDRGLLTTLNTAITSSNIFYSAGDIIGYILGAKNMIYLGFVVLMLGLYFVIRAITMYFYFGAVIKKSVSLIGTFNETKIYSSELISTPLILGLIKPIILFPTSLISRLSPDEMKAIILHESVHINRKDNIMFLLWGVLKSVSVVCPSFYLAILKFEETEEFICDLKACNFTKTKKPFASAILKLTEIQHELNKDVVRLANIDGLAGYSSTARKIEERIDNIYFCEKCNGKLWPLFSKGVIYAVSFLLIVGTRLF